MRCGKCNAYIPGLSSVTSCPECGISIEESQKFHEEILKQKVIADGQAAEELRRSQRSFDYVEAIACSFFSKYFYRDVFRRWGGWGMGYLSFITALVMIPASIAMQASLEKSFEKEFMPIIKQVPHLTVSDGRIRYEGSDPYVIRGEKNDQIIAYFTRSSEHIDFTYVPAGFLITPTEVVIREPATGSRTLNIQPNLKFTVSAQVVEYWARQFTRWMTFFMYPILWLSIIMMALFCAVFYALFGKVVAFFMKLPTDFQNIFRLTIIAFTPSMFLAAVASFWESPGDALDWASAAAPLILITLGLWFNREPKRRKVS